MDRSLARALRAIAADRRSGATEVALRAARAVRTWLARTSPSPPALVAAARALARAQPSMAPVLRLANEIAWGAEDRAALAGSVAAFERRVRTAPARIAARLAHALGAGRPRRVLTWSYSGTVVRALAAARGGIAQVACAEGRPGGEGRTTARRLGAAGLDVLLLTDAALLARVERRPGALVVVGADAVLRGCIVNKVGTSALVALAVARGVPVWTLVDTTKLWPEAPVASRHWMWTFGPPAEVWRAPPDRVEVENPYFDATPLGAGMRLLTEDGWFDARAVARRLARIRISPLLGEP